MTPAWQFKCCEREMSVLLRSACAGHMTNPALLLCYCIDPLGSTHTSSFLFLLSRSKHALCGLDIMQGQIQNITMNGKLWEGGSFLCFNHRRMAFWLFWPYSYKSYVCLNYTKYVSSYHTPTMDMEYDYERVRLRRKVHAFSPWISTEWHFDYTHHPKVKFV